MAQWNLSLAFASVTRICVCVCSLERADARIYISKLFVHICLRFNYAESARWWRQRQRQRWRSWSTHQKKKKNPLHHHGMNTVKFQNICIIRLRKDIDRTKTKNDCVNWTNILCECELKKRYKFKATARNEKADGCRQCLSEKRPKLKLFPSSFWCSPFIWLLLLLLLLAVATADSDRIQSTLSSFSSFLFAFKCWLENFLQKFNSNASMWNETTFIASSDVSAVA